MGHQIVGLVGPEHLIGLLNSLGYRVISGESLRDAAIAILAAQKDQPGDPIPIIVVDDFDGANFAPWLESRSRATKVGIIPGPGFQLEGHPLALSVPSSIADILIAIGVQAPLNDLADTLVGFGGEVLSADNPQPSRSVQGQAVAPVTEVVPTQEKASEPPAPAPSLPEVPPTPFLGDVQTEAARDVPSPTAAPRAEEGDTSLIVPDWMAGVTVTPAAPAEADPAPSAPVAQRPPFGAPVVPSEPVNAPVVHPFQPSPEEVRNDPDRASKADRTVLTRAWGQPAAPTEPQPEHLQPSFAPAPQQTYAPAPQPVYTPATAPAAASASRPVDDFDSFIEQRARPATGLGTYQAAGNVLVLWAAKGGVGKTSLSLAIGESAAQAGMRVCVVDANRGQANITRYTKITNAGLPTIFQARGREWHTAINTAETITQARQNRGPLHFDLVLGPPMEYAAAEDTPASLYAEVIQELKKYYDLVVIDTQIAEADFTDIWNEVIVPEMRSGAWGLGLFDGSLSALPDLKEILQKLEGLGVSSARHLFAGSRLELSEMFSQYATQTFSSLGTFIGAAETDPEFDSRTLGGYTPAYGTGTSADPIIATTLYRITGNELFAPASGRSDKRSGFRLFGKRGRA